MAVAEFIGDAVSAAGYRLCGVETHIAGPDNAMKLIRASCERAALVLISSSIVPWIRRPDLDALLANIRPPVLVVPDVRGLETAPDIESLVNKQLGLLE